MCCFFFFKQKTAYEVRISVWSSDVCSSDLPGPCRVWEAKHANRAEVPIAQHGLDSAGKRRVGQHRVKVHGRLGDGDGMAARGDSCMQIRQRLRVIERRTLGHDPGQEIEGALRLGNEGLEVVAIVEAALLRGDPKKRDRKSTRRNSSH